MIQTIVGNSGESIQAEIVQQKMPDKGFIIGYLNNEPAAVITYYEDSFVINSKDEGDRFPSIQAILDEYNHLTFKFYS